MGCRLRILCRPTGACGDLVPSTHTCSSRLLTSLEQGAETMVLAVFIPKALIFDGTDCALLC
jgi:hypothetical protein